VNQYTRGDEPGRAEDASPGMSYELPLRDLLSVTRTAPEMKVRIAIGTL